MKNRNIQGAFTLLEVLVALTIIAVALAATINAASNMTGNTGDLRARLYASYSAENRLRELQIEHQWPDLGKHQYECTQGIVQLVCEEVIEKTNNRFFRRVQLRVFLKTSNDLTGEIKDSALVQLVGFLHRE